MVKKIISYIFIYILLVGCESPLGCDIGWYLDISAPDLTLDNNGYYHMEFLDGYVQTFSTLEAETGLLPHGSGHSSYNQKVKWISNKEILIAGHWTNLVNGSSYTDDDGKAYTVLGVWENFTGDTIKVYSGYTDNCNIQHIDSLEVVID